MKRSMYGLLLTLGVFLVPLFAQPSKFVIQGARAKGTEEFTTEKTPTGWRQTGKANLQAGSLNVDFNQELVLSSDRELVSYKLEVSQGGRSQVLEAKRDGDKVQLSAGPQT